MITPPHNEIPITDVGSRAAWTCTGEHYSAADASGNDDVGVRRSIFRSELTVTLEAQAAIPSTLSRSCVGWIALGWSDARVPTEIVARLNHRLVDRRADRVLLLRLDLRGGPSAAAIRCNSRRNRSAPLAVLQVAQRQLTEIQ